MTREKPTYRLLNPSGCLTQEALLSFLKSDLDNKDTKKVKAHLEQCELCSDAIEGLSSVQDFERADQTISLLKETIISKLKDSSSRSSKTIRFRNNITWIGAAASIIILIGLLFFLTDTINLNSPDQTAQDLKTEKSEIPAMPETKNQVVANGKKDKTETKQDGAMNEKTKPIIEEEASRPIGEKSIDTDNEDQKVKKITPLKIHKIEDTITDHLFIEKIASTESKDLKEQSAIDADIASTQPVEYYLNEFVVYDHAMENITLDEATVNSKGLNANKSFQGKENRTDSKSSRSPKQEKTSSPEMAKPAQTVRTENEHFFTIVDQIPQFPGGEIALLQYLSNNIQYPPKAAQLQIQGTVVISFIVEKDGGISSAEVVRGIGGGCGEEALRVIQSMPKWQPAFKNGNALRAIFKLPISFRMK